MFEDFFDNIKLNENNRVLLILDGLFSHTRNLDVIILAKEKFVDIFSLRSHTTSKLQPLDKTVMATLKTYYNEDV